MDSNTAQEELRNALIQNDLKYFEIALAMGGDPLETNAHHSESSVYEIALSTYGCGKFVQLCLNNGCSPNYINSISSKAAINYAVDSKDPEIINILLRHPNVQVNRKLCPLSPMSSLLINVKNDNVDSVIACLKRLKEYGARIDIRDHSKQTPLDYLKQNRQLTDVEKRNEIQEILKHYVEQNIYQKPHNGVKPMHKVEGATKVISVYTYREAQDEDTLPQVINCNMDKFKEQFMQYQLLETDQICLLLESIEEDEDEVLDFLLEKQVNYNGLWKDMSPLLFALKYGNSYALKRLLDQKDLIIDVVECPLIVAIMEMTGEHQLSLKEHRRCFYLLLNSKRIDINERDSSGNTALYWALYYHLEEAAKELLKRGAYIGFKNNNNIMPLEYISPKQLHECFDNSISMNSSWGEDYFEIQFDYDILKPPQNEYSNYTFCQEMAPVTFIAESEEHRYLLQHPLISTFLYLKWRQLSFKFYYNMAMYLIFASSFMLYTTLRFSSWEASKAVTLFRIISWIGILYMLVREFLQYLKTSIEYFYSAKNYLELLIIILAIISCLNASLNPETHKTMAVCTMLLIAVELFLLLGYLPVLSMSTHMLMLEAVCLTFLKSFMLYSIFLITFGICFFTLFSGADINGDERNDLSSYGNVSVDSNQFSNPLKAIIKTIVMMTGEFDAGDIEFNTVYSYVLFVLFVFLMTIVLYNLLNGLAVSDIQTIKGQAELNGAICRTKWLTRNETNVNGHAHEFLHVLCRYKWLRPICKRLLYRYPRYRQIHIMPYCNRIRFSADDVDEPVDHIFNLSEVPKIDPAIIKMAMDILERRHPIRRPGSQMPQIEKRLDVMEKKIGEICEMMETILKKKC